MQKSSTRFILPLLSVLTILLIGLAACGPVDLSGAAGGGASDCSHEDGDGDNDHCVSLDGQSGSWSAPAGSEIYSFVIKAGTGDFGAVAGCYEVNQSTTSVSWNRVGDGPDCKEISHVEIYYRISPPPVTEPPVVPPPPTEEPTVEPTEPPTEEPTVEPTEPPTPKKITLCHATGSETNPFVEITVSINAATGLHGHEDHSNDIIPAPADGCPGPTPTSKKPEKITLCHATGSETNPYVEITVSVNAATGLHGHEDHANDIIPAPAGGCPEPSATPEPQKITICHATGSETNPYVEITVSINAATGKHGHEDHAGDIIPAPAGGCPEPSATPEPQKITICHATRSETNPYVEITVSVNAATGLHGHEDHAGDIIPMPADGCPEPPAPPVMVTLCHATGNAETPYIQLIVPVNAATGLTGHEVHTDDIVPMPADGCPLPPVAPELITLCHATGISTNPYIQVTVPIDPVTGLNGHEDDTGDIVPMPEDGCPAPTTTPRPRKRGVLDETDTPTPLPETITFCHSTGDPYPYVRMTVTVDPVTGLTGYEGNINDIIPMPAGGCPEPPVPVEIKLCHATGNAAIPFVEVTALIDPVTGLNGHEADADDIIPAPADGCPKPPETTKIKICHATGDAAIPFTEMTVLVDLATGLTGHEAHTEDIIPMPADGCPQPITPPEPVEVPAVEAPEPGTCPEFIIFHSFREENLEIYRLVGAEGNPNAELINLTRSDAVDCRPSRSPDDAAVVYQSDRNGNVELYYTDMSGSSQTRLTDTDTNNINPMFGPDNQTVTYQSERNGNWDIFTVDTKTFEDNQLTSSSADDVNPFWSTDMRWLVFQTNRNGNWDIYLLDTQTGNEYALVATGANEVFPTWSPNGKQIAYLSDVNGGWNLFVIGVDGQNNSQITEGVTDVGNVSWSPEGTRLAYQATIDGNLDIYTYDLNTDTEYRLTTYVGADSSPTWDCGGANVAFTSTRDGNPNILQVPWQGGSQSNLTIDPATDKWSEWSPAKEFGSRGE